MAGWIELKQVLENKVLPLFNKVEALVSGFATRMDELDARVEALEGGTKKEVAADAAPKKKAAKKGK